MMYTQDYDESFALADLEYVGQKYWYDLTWTKTMQMYIKNLQCFVCPSGNLTWTGKTDPLGSGKIEVSGLVSDPGRAKGRPVVSYGMTTRTYFSIGEDNYRYKNEYNCTTALYDGVGGYGYTPGMKYPSPAKCGGDSFFNGSVPSYTQVALSRPAETVLLQETRLWDNGGCNGFIGFPRVRHTREKVKPTCAGFSPKDEVTVGTINIAFADGHVKGIKDEQIYVINTEGTQSFYSYF